MLVLYKRILNKKGVYKMTEAENEILEEMGFTKTRLGTYQHKLLYGDFDLSSNSLEGVIYDIYHIGVANGRSTVQSEIQKIIGLK